MKNVVDLADIEWGANVFLHELEAGFAAQVSDVGPTAGEKVVDDYNTPAFGKQGIAEMGSEETSASSDQSSVHAFLPFRKAAAGTPSG